MGLKTFTRQDKRKITEDWNIMFPTLGVYEPMHLMNRVGPLLVGIVLDVKSGNDSYFPTFHVHNLCKPFPVVSLGLITKLNREYVKLSWHESKYKELAHLMKDRALIPFEGNLELETILSGFRKYAENPTYPYQPEIYEDMVLISAWCGNASEVQKSLELAEVHMKKWPELVLSRMGGLETWLSNLEEKSQDRDKLKSICEKQIIELKVDKLLVRTLLC